MTHYAHIFSVDGLQFKAHLGYYDDERAKRQLVEVSLRFYFPEQPAWGADDHAKFIDYAKIVTLLGQAVEAGEFRLIEYMAQEVFDLTRSYLNEHGGKELKLWLKLTKSKPPLAPEIKGGAAFILSDLPAGASVIAAD